MGREPHRSGTPGVEWGGACGDQIFEAGPEDGEDEDRGLHNRTKKQEPVAQKPRIYFRSGTIVCAPYILYV